MPYKKFKKNYPRTAKALETAQTALQIAKGVATLVNVEYKHIDTSQVTLSPNTTGSVVSLNACAEGTTSETRNGLSVRNKSLLIRWASAMHGSATLTRMRIVVFIDRSPNGTLATWNELMEQQSTLSQTNNVNNYRFRILWDRHFSMDGEAHDTHDGKIYKKLNLITKYENANGTANDLSKNQLCIAYISNESVNTPQFVYSARVRFIDN